MSSTESPDPVHTDGTARAPSTTSPMSLTEIQSSYDEMADWLHRFEFLDRAITGRYRRERFSDVTGRVLDVACGTGTNFRYLPASAEVVGVDISPEVLEKAESRLHRLGLDGNVQQMDAQQLGFPDDAFDAVISSMSTCTFPDPIAALREMERVCDPDGTIRLVEHGLSDVGPLARFQQWRADAHYAKAGCRWTQEPREVVADAGLTIEDTSTGRLGMMTTFEITPD